MSKPVIFDDGGSLRIRQVTDTKHGNMDGLLADPPSDTTPDAFAANSCFLTVRFHSENGTHHTVQTPTASALKTNDLITITSASGQVTNIAVVAPTAATNVLNISIPDPAAGAPGSPALVYCTQDAATARRRYIVTNSGTISSVDYTPSGGALANLFDAIATPSIFTMVHFGITKPGDQPAKSHESKLHESSR